MKAFLSFGLHREEMYWLTILAEELEKQGISIITQNNLETSFHGNLRSIFNCDIYIALLTNHHEIQRIVNEFNNAIRKIPSLLLVDKNIFEHIRKDNYAFKINPKMIDYIIPLKRENLNDTRKIIQSKIDSIKNDFTKKNIAWLIGGIAIISLLNALSDDR